MPSIFVTRFHAWGAWDRSSGEHDKDASVAEASGEGFWRWTIRVIGDGGHSVYPGVSHALGDTVPETLAVLHDGFPPTKQTRNLLMALDPSLCSPTRSPCYCYSATKLLPPAAPTKLLVQTSTPTVSHWAFSCLLNSMHRPRPLHPAPFLPLNAHRPHCRSFNLQTPPNPIPVGATASFPRIYAPATKGREWDTRRGTLSSQPL